MTPRSETSRTAFSPVRDESLRVEVDVVSQDPALDAFGACAGDGSALEVLKEHVADDVA